MPVYNKRGILLLPKVIVLNPKDGGVITDGNITTARGLGYALDLGIELIRLLMGPQHAQMVKDSIQYDQV